MRITDQIREWELKLVDPEFRKDPNLVSPLLSDEFEEFGSSGRVYRKADVLENLELAPDARYVLSDFRFTELSSGCILVKFASEVSGVHAHRSSIWSNRSGTWQMLHHQSTVVTGAT
jgi:hypothetical protein